MLNRRNYCNRRRSVYRIGICFIILIILFIINFTSFSSKDSKLISTTRFSSTTSKPINITLYEEVILNNQSLCNDKTHRFGFNQKVISISIFGLKSQYADNKIFSWNTTIMPYLEALSNEVHEILPSWIIRIYTDFIDSTQEQREIVYKYSNIDVCDMNNLPMLGSKLLEFLPGKIWRFLPIYDPYVDYMLSRDLDSPMTKRETETLNLWLAPDQTNNFFYIARDHKEHSVPILGGLWGAAPARARNLLHEIFQVMLKPDLVREYKRARDQDFLTDFVWKKVQNRSLIFDSAYCETFGGQPFPFQRSDNYCFLGCYRPCCTPAGIDKSKIHASICPKACRPKEHQDWEYC